MIRQKRQVITSFHSYLAIYFKKLKTQKSFQNKSPNVNQCQHVVK